MRIASLFLLASFVASLCGCDGSGSSTQKAATHLAAGRLDEARIEASNALQADERDVQAHLVLARTLIAQGDFVTADSVLGRAAKLAIGRPDVDRLRARLFLRIRSYDRLLNEIRPTTEHHGEARAEILAARGQAQLATGRFDEARTSFAESLRVDSRSPDSRVGQAQLAFREGKSDEAMKTVDQILAEYPSHVLAWYAKAGMLEIRGDIEQALLAYDKAAQADPHDTLAHLAAAEMQLRVGRLEGAQKSVDLARKRTPRAIPVHFVQVLIEFERGRFDQVLGLTHEMLRIEPGFLAAQLLAARAFIARGEFGQAEERLRAVMQSMPEDPMARRLLAEILLRSDNAPRALEVLRPILSNRSDAAAAKLAADAHIRMKEYARAVAYYEDAVRLQPNQAVPLAQLAVARYATGDTAQGLALLQRASSLPQGGFHAQVLLAMEALGRRDFKRALSEAQALQARAASNPIAYNLDGIAKIGLKDVAGARSSFERAARLDSRFWPAVANLVRLDLAAGRRDEATQRVERFLAEDKTSPEAWAVLVEITGDRKRFFESMETARQADPKAFGVRQMLTRAYLQSGLAERALLIAREIAAIAPGRAEALETLGIALLAAGHPSEALTAFREMSTQSPGAAVAHMRLGQTALALGDHPNAEASFRKALQIEPGNLEATSGLAGLMVRSARTTDAVRIVDELKKANAHSGIVEMMKGDVLNAAGRFREAAESYDKAFKERPSGAVLIQWHKASIAARDAPTMDRLLLWIRTNPTDLVTRAYIGDRLYLGGQYRAALEHYEAVLKSDPYRASVHNNLASTLLQLGDRRAVAAAEAAHRLNPDDGAILDTLGMAQLQLGDPETAVQTLRKARARLSNSAAIRVHYAIALARTGQKDAARSELKSVLADNKSFELDVEAREILEKR